MQKLNEKLRFDEKHNSTIRDDAQMTSAPGGGASLIGDYSNHLVHVLELLKMHSRAFRHPNWVMVVKQFWKIVLNLQPAPAKRVKTSFAEEMMKKSGDSKYDKRNGGCEGLGKGGVPNPEILENFICAYPLMPN